MAIIYDDVSKTLTLHTDNSTYQMQIDRFGYLIHLYYGRRTAGCMDWILTYVDRGLSGSPYDAGPDRTYSLDALPQEYPVQGTGDYRSPAMMVRSSKGTYGCNLKYRRHEITQGKYGLKGLPAVYSENEEDDAETLSIVLGNSRTGIEVELLYGVLPHLDIITRSVIVRNEGKEGVTVIKLLSANLDFTGGDFDIISFYGRHTMERVPQRARLGHGSFNVSSRRGASSHQFNPFVILADHDATERSGRCWSMQFVYSGGFTASAELDQYGQTRLQMGLSDEKFAYPLEVKGELVGPEVIMSFSSEGLGKLSNNLHKCIRSHVCRGRYRDTARPVLLNSWEASYFDFTGETLLGLADSAADLGVDMLVVDDGWFGNRSDDRRALGDWKANEKKLGMTLAELIRRVNDKGIKFGIWVEPEMISEDSDLYREHPDWAMVIPGEKPVLGRNQLVLDFSRREVVEKIYDDLCEVLDQGNIEYLKWDYNRSIADVYSHTADDQGRVLYDYMLGLYDMLERLVQRYPDLLIEGCSGGGGRFDAGMLYYTPQIWCSDNTDALDRLIIQYGTSFGYPSQSVGSHVSACPNHQTGRSVSLRTRGAAAMSGTFGYELDPALLTEEEKEEIRGQIMMYRVYSDLVRNGLYYRLSDPTAGDICAWEHVSEDGMTALITSVIPYNHGNLPTPHIIPRGLTPGGMYRLQKLSAGMSEAAALAEENASNRGPAGSESDGVLYAADALMDAGLPLPLPKCDAESYIYILTRVNSEDSVDSEDSEDPEETAASEEKTGSDDKTETEVSHDKKVKQAEVKP